MKDRAVVSERGTLTIPGPIREIAHIHPGDLIEFEPLKDKIILRHLVLRHSAEEAFMANSEWGRFDKLVRRQLKKGQYKSYGDLDKAKAHSRKLMHKK
ncbi:MAG TPA: AbrB/MazE/SpoVT family DNA-binding domain-containing protein [Candidatus Omnitrophota bacterium]|nr:AbrB/MazE/SpoVT family DNA-binding domain-containing protein [Candidatus Omnitrophota bacterium]